MGTNFNSPEKTLRLVRQLFKEVDPNGTFEPWDYLHAYGRESEALLYFALFCPPLVEVDGSVLLQESVQGGSDRERFVETKKAAGREAAERSFNLTEVPYMFGPDGRDLSDEDDRVLAEAIRVSWGAWLGAQFPNRKFVVEVMEVEKTGSVVGIHFFELRQAESGTTT